MFMVSIGGFQQTFVSSPSWEEGELIRFGGQKIKGQGHVFAKG